MRQKLMNQKQQLKNYVVDTPIAINDYIFIDEFYQEMPWYHSSIMKVLSIDAHRLTVDYEFYDKINSISVKVVNKLDMRKIKMERLINEE